MSLVGIIGRATLPELLRQHHNTHDYLKTKQGWQWNRLSETTYAVLPTLSSCHLDHSNRGGKWQWLSETTYAVLPTLASNHPDHLNRGRRSIKAAQCGCALDASGGNVDGSSSAANVAEPAPDTMSLRPFIKQHSKSLPMYRLQQGPSGQACVIAWAAATPTYSTNAVTHFLRNTIICPLSGLSKTTSKQYMYNLRKMNNKTYIYIKKLSQTTNQTIHRSLNILIHDDDYNNTAWPASAGLMITGATIGGSTTSILTLLPVTLLFTSLYVLLSIPINKSSVTLQCDVACKNNKYVRSS